MIEFWRDLLNFLFESVFESFAIPLTEIYEKTKLNNRKPVGLQNILQELVNRGEYILSSSLKTDDYFKKNYSNLYKKDGWGTWLKNGVITSVKIPFNYIGLTSNQIEHANTREYKSDELFINKKHFHHHLTDLVNLLSKILMEEDIEVVTKMELRSILLNSDLKYKELNLDLCINYLNKIKKVQIFKVKIENVEMECIKLLHDENSSVSEKDKAIINILVQLKNFDRKIDEMMSTIQSCLLKAKEFLKNKNREAASHCIKKKNIYLNAYNHYSNLKMTLEQNLIDIKSMQTNQNVKNILEDVLKTSEKLKMNVEEFNEIADKMKSQRDDLKEAKGYLAEYSEENLNVNSFHYFRTNH
jgi:hypothetical protein